MDGMKLDEKYRQRNGLGPVDPDPKLVNKTPAKERFTFDTPGVENAKDVLDIPPKKTKVVAPTKTEVIISENQPEEVGFIDRVLAEDNKSKKKLPKEKKASKKPFLKPKKEKVKKTPKVQKVQETKESISPLQQEAKQKPVELSQQETKRKAAKQSKEKLDKRAVSKKDKTAKVKKKAKSKKVLHGSLTQQLVMAGKIVVFAAVLIFALYNYLEVKRLNNIIDDTEIGQQAQTSVKNKEIIDTISGFRALPDSEYEIYTVKDKSKLADELVFQHAENGDKVIVYPDESLTIVYRESENKIISESRDSSLTEDN